MARCCGICPGGCVLQEKARTPASSQDYYRPPVLPEKPEVLEPKPKPKIEADHETVEIRTWDRVLVRIVRSPRWLVSCECVEDVIVATTWETALEVALTHGRTHA